MYLSSCSGYLSCAHNTENERLECNRVFGLTLKKLKDKGFKSSDVGDEMLKGEFNGRNVYLSVVTNNNKVYRIVINDAVYSDEINTIIRFNELCKQFQSNGKYMTDHAELIPTDEDISYEMSVNNVRYDAAFYQLPTESSATSGSIDFYVPVFDRCVWFMIAEYMGQYGIVMYYDNLCNQASGEDL